MLFRSLLAREGARVRVASRDERRAAEVVQRIRTAVADSQIPESQIEARGVADRDSLRAALDGVQVVIAAGAAGICLLPAADRLANPTLRVAIDLNAVPPLGIEGVEVMVKAKDRDGVCCYGAIGVGGTKMKIHKASLKKLFEANNLVLDAEQIFAVGRELP